jgi:hypothetical protein
MHGVFYFDFMRQKDAQRLSRNNWPVLLAAGLSGLTLAVWAFAPTPVLIGFLCLLVSAVVGLLFHLLIVVRSRPQQPELLQLLLDLASDDELASIHSSLAQALKDVARQKDPIFRELAMSRLETIVADCQVLGNGTVEFTSTESWRVVYEALLRSPGLHLYRSVAYIETAHYWQDGPGRQSTQLNLELHDAGVISIERTAVIADHLWPDDELFPCDPLHSWLDQQHRYGIWLRLVRESALENDTDLLCDYGIYGSRAVGLQTADPAGRTIRFVLDFNFEKVQEAERNWNRLAVYATSYRDLLDQQH